MELHAVLPQNKWKRLIFRVLVCALLLLIPIIDAPSPKPTSLLMFRNPFLGIDFVLHAACLLFGYINFYFLLPRFFYKKSKSVYFFCVTLCLVSICTIPTLLAVLPMVPYFPSNAELQIHTIIQIRHIFFLFMITLLFGILTQAEIRRRQAEREKMVAELRYLKAQINPHFLFNTLNSIYALLLSNPEEAGKSLIKMSNIMRHLLNTSENHYEELDKTLDVLKDYISLQKERFRDTILLKFSINGNLENLLIAPLLIIPFVENAFKYGINPSEQSEIIIRVDVLEKTLKLFVSNRDYHQLNFIESTGIGLENAQNRLKMLYHDRYKLNITKENGFFTVELILQLD